MNNDPINDYSIRIHPYQVIVFLMLTGLSALFIALTCSYLYQRVVMNIEPINLPLIFLFNSFILIGCSYFIKQANVAYLADDTDKYIRSLYITTGLTVVFMIAQYIGWQLMMQNDMMLSDGPATSYLYLLSGLHILHIVGGLPALLWFIYKAVKYMKEPVTVLVYFSDPDRRLKLKLLTTYWHFLDVLWIYLVVFFMVMSLF